MNIYYKNIIDSFRGNTRGSKAKREIIYSVVIQGVSVIVGLLYVPLLLNYLSQEKYGVWITLTSILEWVRFFDIGLGNGLRNKLTVAIAKEDFKLGKKLVSTTYTLLGSIFIPVLILFHIGNLFLDWDIILNTKSIENSELYTLTSIVFTFFIIRFVVQIISVVYLADQKPSFTKLITTSGNFLSFIVILILTKITIKGNLIVAGIIISAIPVILFILVSIVSFNTRFKQLKPSFKEIDFKASKGILNLGVKFFFMQITYIIIFSTSSFFIAQFYGPKEVTIYNIAFKYFQIPVMLFSIILSPIWSAVTDAYTKSDYNWLKRTLKYLNILSGIFSVGVILMIFISNWVYRIWVGKEIVIPISLTATLGIYTIIQLVIIPYSNFINGMGKLKLTVSFAAVGISIYLISIYVFGNLFKNSTGIILAIIVTNILGSFLQPIQIHKLLNKTAKGIWNK